MKKFGLNTRLMFASWALLLAFGCHKKKPNIPPEETPPTILSEVLTESAEPPAQQTPPATQEPQAVNKPPEKPAHPPSRHPKTHAAAPKKSATEPDKPAPTEEARNIPPSQPTPPTPRVVIQESGVNSGTGQVTSDTSKDNSDTQQLLASAETNVRNIKRDLSTDEKAMLKEVNDYIQQSKEATQEGDNVRAHNLALKARTLSDELVKK